MSKHVFNVEFGEPSIDSYRGTTYDPVVVIATSYDEAAKKAVAYIESLPDTGVVLEDGSLKIKERAEVKVRTVRMISEKVIH
jgi:hypothetical protein